MSATNTQTTSTKKTESQLISRIAFGALGLLLVGIVLVYALLYFGSVNGEEFSSDSFRRRTFSYLEIPLIGVQITPIRHLDTTADLETYLTTQKLLPKPAKPENRWDLVLASKGRSGATQGDARILCQYLDAVNEDNDKIWLKWSEEHVELAKVVWPAVAEVARHELYIFVPDIFVLARTASTPEQLQQRIDQVLADKYFLTAETLEALEQSEIAAELFAEVLRHAPDRAETVRGRDRIEDAKTDEPKAEKSLGDDAREP